MKYLSLILAVVTGLSAFAGGRLDAQNRKDIPVFEYKTRGGLPNFYAKVKDGKSVRVAYFGGSITSQAGWRVQSMAYLRKTFPQAEISEIHAAIGGTGSTLGAYRLENDVLKHEPDLVFVEFAVNDAGMRPEENIRSMEGIVRQIWQKLPECDICFVYTFFIGEVKILLAGKLPPSICAMEMIADYYHIASVFMGYDALALLRQDKLVMRIPKGEMTHPSGDSLNKIAAMPRDRENRIVFANDGVHPLLDTGHVLYTDVLIRALAEFARHGKSGSRLPMPEPLDRFSLVNVSSVSLDSPQIQKSGSIQENPMEIPEIRVIARRTGKAWKLQPGAELNFKFKGSQVMLYAVFGPGCGSAEVTVDGKKQKACDFFDKYCGYSRVNTVMMAKNLDPQKVHAVKIRISDQKLDKRAILLDSNKVLFDKTPSLFEPHNVYIGTIFMDGIMVE